MINFKRTLLPLFGVMVMAAAMSAEARMSANGLMFNGVALNGTGLNGVALNGRGLNGSGPSGDVAFQALRLALPDGTKLTFR